MEKIMDIFELKSVKNAVVIGAGHGIGYALVSEISLRNPKALITATYRRASQAKELIELANYRSNISQYEFDPNIETQYGELFNHISQSGPIDMLINSAGTLALNENNSYKIPEKSLRDIDFNALMEVFKVNSFITPMLAKYAKPFLCKEKASVFCSLSAKVGSITDNELGGWYSYRSSKAALNMFLKTISIEYKRSGLKTIILALHPGTTETRLSGKFLGSVKHKVWNTKETAAHILDVFEGLNMSDSGTFKNWDGQTLPW
jgi:NAD(P)-dependent dehydrogenase (short-subunit alcohol dehydrogenase family)